MSYDGAGNYSLPPGSTAVTGNTILASEHNVPLTDIEAALSQVLLRSGVAPMTGNLNMGGHTITNSGGVSPGAFLTEGDVGTSGHKIPRLDAANTWSATTAYNAAVTITQATSSAVPLELRSTSADNLGGPILSLYRNSATPADGDDGPAIYFQGQDSTATKTAYATIQANFVDVTNPTEDGELLFRTISNGTSSTRMVIGAGIYHPSATGGDKGAGTINFQKLYIDGVEVTATPGPIPPPAPPLAFSSSDSLAAELQALRDRVAELEAKIGT
jgi:hypothetical protein